jgi:hypothetical protein
MMIKNTAVCLSRDLAFSDCASFTESPAIGPNYNAATIISATSTIPLNRGDEPAIAVALSALKLGANP